MHKLLLKWINVLCLSFISSFIIIAIITTFCTNYFWNESTYCVYLLFPLLLLLQFFWITLYYKSPPRFEFQMWCTSRWLINYAMNKLVKLISSAFCKSYIFKISWTYLWSFSFHTVSFLSHWMKIISLSPWPQL